MNNQRKQAALKNFATAVKTGTKEEVTDLLKSDAKKYSAAEQKEILAALYPAAAKAPVVKLAPPDTNTTTTSNGPGNNPPPPDLTQQAPPAPKKNKAAGTGANPSVEEFLAGIDYTALTGKMFKTYVEMVGDRCVMVVDDETGEEKALVGKLLLNEEFVFEQFRVTPLRKIRYAGVKDSPMDFVGLKIKDSTPVHTSKMNLKTALELNAQILNMAGLAGHGKYYLLKK